VGHGVDVPFVDKPEMADKPFVEDGVNRVAIVGAALRPAAKTGPLGNRITVAHPPTI
jgi:hypothetical protein